MKKLLMFHAIALVIALLATAIFTIGCSCLLPSPVPYGPKVTDDGTGGAIVVYEDVKGGNQHDFYAQKISPNGNPLWGETGVLIGSGYKESDSFFDLFIVDDGSGGAVIAWSAYPSEPDWRSAPGQRQVAYLTHVTKVDSEGNNIWQKEIKSVIQMISDGAGGAIITTDYEGTLFIKIDSEGNYPWGEDGVSIYHKGYGSNSLQLASDAAGGAIVICEELESQPGPEPHSPKITLRIFAQRINAEGSLSWGQEGVLLYTTPEWVYAEEPKVISASSGGAIAVWHQWPSGVIEGGSPQAILNDVYAQKVDAIGNILWQQNGVPLEITKAAVEASPHTSLLVGDGSGSAIVIWEDLRHGLASIYAQRIGADGSINWRAGGEEVCYIKTNASFWPTTAVSDGSGGAIIACSYKEAETGKKGLLVQRLDATGRALWGNGVVVTERDHITHVISPDGQGGAIVAWGSGKSMFKSERSYVQRIDSTGKLLWGAEGIRLNE
jgi:hypothetical protein